MSLSADASAVLAKQIEEMTPSAAVLESVGFTWETAATLARFITTGAPDINALKEHGLSLETAISICEAIGARHARKAAALAALKPPAPAAPAPVPEPVPPLTDDDVDAALWRLAELADMIRRGETCVTLLCRAGYTEHTAKEIAALIRISKRN